MVLLTKACLEKVCCGWVCPKCGYKSRLTSLGLIFLSLGLNRTFDLLQTPNPTRQAHKSSPWSAYVCWWYKYTDGRKLWLLVHFIMEHREYQWHMKGFSLECHPVANELGSLFLLCDPFSCCVILTGEIPKWALSKLVSWELSKKKNLWTKF